MKKFFFSFLLISCFAKPALCVYYAREPNYTYVGADNQKLICTNNGRSCTDASSEPYTGLVYRYDDELLSAELNFKNGLQDGIQKYYDFDGALKRIQHIKNNHHGLYKTYYPNGQLKEEGNYEHGSSPFGTKIHQRYYPNGQIETLVENDFELEYYENGQLHTYTNYPAGSKKNYYQDGTLEYESDIIDGEQIYKHYYPSGKIKIEGKKIIHTTSFPDNPLQPILIRTTNGKTEKLKIPHTYSKLDVEKFFKEGKHDGILREYYENGQIKVEKNYQNGELIEIKAYDDNGQLLSEEEYKAREKAQEEEERVRLTERAKTIVIVPE